MPLNADLFNKLNNKDFLLSKSEAEHNALLNALLSADARDLKAFRKAVASQKDVLNYDQEAEKWLSSHYGRAFRSVKKEDFYTSDEFLEASHRAPTLDNIQQAAAAQRVKFNLSAATDKDVLIAILGNQNSEECRRYLATKVATEIDTVPGWKSYTTSNKEEYDLLTDEALNDIQKLAAAYRIYQALDEASPEASANLVKNKNDSKAFFAIIRDSLKVNILKGSEDLPFIWDVIGAKADSRYQQSMAFKIGAEVFDAISKQKTPGLSVLSALDAAVKSEDPAVSELDAVKKALQPIAGTAADLINERQISDIKKVAREQIFKLYIESYSSLPCRCSSSLVEVFAKLDEAQQRAKISHHSSLIALLNAKELKVLQSHFPGIDDKDLKPILENNSSNALFKSIYNAEIAQILRVMDPSVDLTQEKVDELNKLLLKTKGDSLADEAKYSGMVKAIGVLLRISSDNEPAFYGSFGLDDDGEHFVADVNHLIRDKIKKQITNNENLVLVHEETTTKISSHLLNLLFQIRKNEPMTREQVKNLQIAFINSNDFSELNNRLTDGKLITDSDARWLLPKNLSQNLYSEIKKEAIDLLKSLEAEALATTISSGTAKGLEHIRKDLQTLQNSNLAFDEYKKTVAFIPQVTPEYIYSPLFRNDARAMKRKYAELASQCDVVIEQLQHHGRKVADYLDKLPKSAGAVQILRDELLQEQANINKRLHYFETVTKACLSGKDGILETIDGSFGSKAYTYQPESVSTYITKKDKVPKDFSSKKLDATSTSNLYVNQSSQAKKDTPFILEEIPNKDEVRCFDVVHTIINKERTIKTEGRFIYENTDKNAMSVSTQGKQSVTRYNPGKFEVLQFPKSAADSVDTANNEDLTKARVNFAMVMAAQALTTLDGPPTKERPIILRGTNEMELKYLWTALMVLGEINPRLKFGSEAVQVYSTNFIPQNEKGKLWGYSATSLYNTAFKEYREMSQLTAKDSVAHSEKVFGGLDQRDVVNNSSEFFKQELKSTKAEVEQRRNEEKTTAPEGPKTSI